MARNFCGPLFLVDTIMRKTLLVLSLMACSTLMMAQYSGSSFWYGMIKVKFNKQIRDAKFELDYNISRMRVTGTTRLFLDNMVIVRDVKGYIYRDESIYLEEQPVDKEFALYDSLFIYKKFQFPAKEKSNIHDGHWQEIISDPLSPTRQRGRLRLVRRKVKTGA